MSYNGVGLQTPRGTGTSGYIQKNVANRNVEGFRQKRMRDALETERREVRARMKEARRTAGKDVNDHLDKRKIDVKCMELRDELEDADVEEDVIKSRIEELRKQLMAEATTQHNLTQNEPSEIHHNVSRRQLVELQESERLQAKNKLKEATKADGDKKEPIKDEQNNESSVALETEKVDVQEKNQTPVKESESLEGPSYNYIPRYSKR